MQALLLADLFICCLKSVRNWNMAISKVIIDTDPVGTFYPELRDMR